MGYFSQAKNEQDKKAVSRSTVMLQPGAASAPQQTSKLARGMLITGNIVSTDPLEINGQVVGDIHAAQLTICEGAVVEGNVIAQNVDIQGRFKGSINGNSVKLRGTAVVDGEIFNRSLTIEQDAQFEGFSRRLDKPVEAPSHLEAEWPKQSADVVPISDAVA